jgi:hypothetical protein
VTKLASSDARNATTFAISIGSPILPSGWIDAISRSVAAGSSASSTPSMRVRVYPGQTAFARIPNAPSSSARLRVMPMTPDFAAA